MADKSQNVNDAVNMVLKNVSILNISNNKCLVIHAESSYLD